MRRQVTLVVLALSLLTPIVAEEESTLRVAASVLPPCVIESNQSLAGFSIDLWDAIADELDQTYETELVSFAEKLDSVKSNEADVAIGCVTITGTRESELDFTHPVANGGYQVVSLISSSLIPTFSDTSLQMLGLLLVFVVVFAHLIWLSERGHPSIRDAYFPGVFEAVWFSIVTMSTVGYGDIAPKQWLGRISTVLLILTGVTAFGLIFGQFAADAIEDRVQHPVSSIQSLQKYRIGTKTDTETVNFLESLGIQPQGYNTISDASEAMRRGEIDIVIHDSLAVADLVSKSDDMLITGPTFSPHYLGIALRQGSELREPINQAILKLQQNGLYESIYSRWF